MSRKKGLSTAVLFFLFLNLLWGAALERGMSPAEVEAILGEPNGTRKLVDGRLWVYSGDISLRFVDGALRQATGVDMVVPELKPVQESEPVQEPETAEEENPSDNEGAVEADEAVSQPAEESVENPAGAGKETAAPASEESLDEEIETMGKIASDPTSVLKEEKEEGTGTEEDGFLSQKLLVAVVLTLFQFGILWLACRITGIEAYAFSLLFIAVMDRLVIHWMRWVFLGFLEFPTTFHADSLVSFLVMLVLFMKFSSAKSLPSALKVVVASKIVALGAAYLVLMFVLLQL